MGRRKKGRRIHGWVIVDKPIGMSSAQVVGKVRWLLDAQKAGHGGTLDPLASGVLPIALGEATKTMAFVMDGRKAYRCWVKFGTSTTTDDAEGTVVETSDTLPDAAAIEKALGAFKGTVEQIPPIYSAIKIDGRRAYQRARANEDVVMKPRLVHIDALTLVEMPAPDLAIIDVECAKGTYIRALARDLAKHLGTVGHVQDLRRTLCGPFDESRAISLDSLEALGHSARLEEGVLSLMTALDDIPALALSEAETEKLRQGQCVPASVVLSRNPGVAVPQGDTAVVLHGNIPVALARIEDGEVRPVRVFNL